MGTTPTDIEAAKLHRLAPRRADGPVATKRTPLLFAIKAEIHDQLPDARLSSTATVRLSAVPV